MDDTKLRHTDRKFLVATIARVKDQAMTWAVHRLETPLLLLNVEDKHIVFVILPMTRGLPKFAAEHVRRNDWEGAGLET